jgi:DNA-binding transcriptional regulator YdaS (Cro superfamily)
MTADAITNVSKARNRWGAAAPEWIIVLAEVCDRAGQTAIAKKLGVSSTVISQALSNTYPSPLASLERRVRGELMNETVPCPVLAEITKRRCMDEQSKPYAATNALRVELRRACPRCQNFLKKEAA